MSLKKEVIICLGTGGVGKTTLACVMGLHQALSGKKTLIVTLDPAKRLLDALSIKTTTKDIVKVNVKKILGLKEKVNGSLFALVPDVSKEWLDFLITAIKREDRQKKIFNNHFYQYMAQGMPGSLEIICCHLLYRLQEKNEFDVIILDTPPASHSVSFFEVPKKLSTLLDDSILQKIMNKRTAVWLFFTKNLMFLSGGLINKTLERLIGSHFLSEFIDFAFTVGELYAPMLKRCQAMEQLWQSNMTKFVLVTRPSIASVADSIELKENLVSKGIEINEIIINQTSEEIHDILINNELANLTELEKRDLQPLIMLQKDICQMEQKLIYKLKPHFKNASWRVIRKDYGCSHGDFINNLYQSYQRGFESCVY